MKNPKLKIQLFLILALMLTFFACEDDGTTIITPPNPEPQITITTTVRGRVIDENNQAIEGAMVHFKSGEQLEMATTDADGNFDFSNIRNKGKSAFLSVQQVGKFEAFRRLSVIENKANFTEIKMKTKQILGQVNSTNGGTLNHNSGAKISLPAQGIVDANGNAYSGTVDVAMTWIDPSADDLPQQMVGDLSGINSDGETVTLGTFGMLQIELLDASGNELNLAEGAESTLVFPVPTSLQSKAPTIIPLWSYDEEQGTWMQEGEATYANGVYTGNVSHFSSWNVDCMTDPIEIKGQVTIDVGNKTTQPSYMAVYVCGQKFGQKGGWLDEEGSFLFYNFPKDEVFDLKIVDECGTTIYQETYGPYSTDTDLGTIAVNSTNMDIITVSGNVVDCDGNTVSNGYLKIAFSNKSRTFSLEEDGSFDISLDLCEGAEPVLTVVDLDNQLTSSPITISGASTNTELGEITTCEELSEYILLDIEGQEQVLFVKEQIYIDSLLATGGFIGGYHVSSDSLIYTIILILETNTPFEENVNYSLDHFEYSSEDATNNNILLNLTSNSNNGDNVTINFTTCNDDLKAGSFEGTVSNMNPTTGETIEQVQISGSFRLPVE